MEKYSSINNKKISFNDFGNGEVIILLHGYLETKEVWNSLADKLSTNFRVIAIDIPGHGKSEMLNDCQTMHVLATQVKALLNELNIDQCTMVGHSMGGYVMLAFAELFPEMLNGLVLFHSSIYADTDEKRLNRQREIELIENDKLELIVNTNIPNTFANSNVEQFKNELEAIKIMAKSHKKEGVCSLLRAMMTRSDQQELIKTFPKPMLFIFGKKDNYIPVETGEKMAALNHNIQVVWLENSGHMGFIEEEKIIIKTLKKFAYLRLP